MAEISPVPTPASSNVPPQAPAPLLTPLQTQVKNAALAALKQMAETPVEVMPEDLKTITISYLVPEDYITELVKLNPMGDAYKEFTKGIKQTTINILVSQLLKTNDQLILTSNILKLSAKLEAQDRPNYRVCRLDRTCTDDDLLYLINNFPDVEFLELNSCNNITDLGIGHLQNLPKLTNLKLIQCLNVTSLKPLTKLTGLLKLSLERCSQITNLSPLSSLIKLISLDLRLCLGISDLTPISNLTNLIEIDLSMCDKITDLDPLRGLTKLRALYIEYCYRILTIEPLMGLPALRELIKPGCVNVPALEIEELRAGHPNLQITEDIIRSS